MKKLLLSLLIALSAMMVSAGDSLSINVSTAGGLKAAITAAGGKLTTISNLTITGSIDVRDFVTMRSNMSKLAIVDLSGTTIVAYEGKEGTSYDTIVRNYPANTIPIRAFSPSHLLSVVKFPLSLTSIGDQAFCFCNKLSSIDIPESVTNIGLMAFVNCINLSSIFIPANVSSIGQFAFTNSYAAITVDANNLSYASEEGVLFNKAKTNLIQCPSSKTGSYIIPSSVTSIGDGAFKACSSLISVNIPVSLTTIGESAFQSCTSLISVNIPASVKTIEDFTFDNCTSLTSVNIHASLTTIGISAFYNCYASINVDANNPKFASEDGILFNKDKTALIQCTTSKNGNYTIPSSVITIGESAFYSCTGLTSVNIPASVTSIGYGAFSNCSKIDSFFIPSSVDSIGDFAFACAALETIVVAKSKPLDIAMNTFSEVNKNTCTLVVPTGSKAAYQAAAYWKNFKNIKEAILPVAVDQPVLQEAGLYPNPATNTITITGSKLQEIRIVNLVGICLLQVNAQGQNTLPIDISALKPGCYIVRVKTNNRSERILKFCKK